MNSSYTPSVWVVDDDEDDLLFIKSAFLQGDPAVETFLIPDSTNLITKLDTCLRLPRLILLDVNMPRLNGLELLAQLRSLPAYYHLPVIMLTTSSNEQDRRAALLLGANDYLVKPVSYHYFQVIAQSLRQQWALSQG